MFDNLSGWRAIPGCREPLSAQRARRGGVIPPKPARGASVQPQRRAAPARTRLGWNAMAADFHKPTQYSGDKFDEFEGGEDPAQILRVAHDTAHALLNRARQTDDPEVIARLVAYTDGNGLDALAELWARSSPRSLPGALWRIYLIRVVIRQDPDGTSYLFQRGTEVLPTIDAMVAGAPTPTGPDEITELADQILRGLFRGDFAIALDRAASFCRILAAGCTSVADDSELTNPERSTELTTRADRLALTAEEFTACARLYRAGDLE